MFSSTQTYFNQAVILVFEHTREYSAGVIVNKPSNVKLLDLDLTPLLPMYANNTLYVGGDVGEDVMQLMHGAHVEGAREILKGVFFGGESAVADRIRAGDMEALEVRPAHLSSHL